MSGRLLFSLLSHSNKDLSWMTSGGTVAAKDTGKEICHRVHAGADALHTAMPTLPGRAARNYGRIIPFHLSSRPLEMIRQSFLPNAESQTARSARLLRLSPHEYVAGESHVTVEAGNYEKKIIDHVYVRT
jgi:hypothetical protein